MTLGEKIKSYRKNKGLSQEQLAESIYVSRQAITKWERDGGIPELSNLIALSEVFGVSIGELVEEDTNINSRTHDNTDQTDIEPGYYDIDLSGWNDGEYNVLMVNEDADFFYFVKHEKGNDLGIAIRKKYITGIKKLNKGIPSDFAIEKIGREYFNGKIVSVELAKKEGFFDGFFDFRDDDYQSCKIENIDETKVFLEWGRSLTIDEITKIVEA